MSPRSARNPLAAIPYAVICLLLATTLVANARTRPHYGGTLHIEVEGEPLDPNGIAQRLVLDGLTQLDPQGQVRPALATRWTTENDNHRWQFWLRPNVSFHDSHPFNAPAAVASLEAACHKAACPWSAIHISAQSIVITSDDPISNLPAILAEDAFLIREAASTEDPAATSVIGTGPFRVKESNPNGLQLEANDDSWQGRPFVDAIQIASHRAIHDQWMDLASGKADIVEVHPSDVRQARQQRLNLVVSPVVSLLALEIDNTSLPPQLRAAIASAVDRAALFQVIFQKQGEITASLLPGALTGYSFLFPTNRDLARAIAMRGGINPPPLTLSYDQGGPLELAAERLALNLRDAGFAVKVVTARTSDLRLRAFPLAGDTPSHALEEMLRNVTPNPPGIPDDPGSAYKSERDFLAQHAVVPLVYLPRAWAVSSRVRDLRLTAQGIPDFASLSLTASSNGAAQ